MKAKKSYGQHFLNSEGIARRIAQSLQQLGQTYEHIVEVGPGRGMLTRFLTELETQLWLVEADKDMVVYLNEHYPELRERTIEADFLKIDLLQLLQNKPFALIGNYPYNISSQILFKMVENRAFIPEMVGMFQKEVAERVVSPPGTKDYGVISVLVQAFYRGEYLFSVDKAKFNPPPKVQSGVIRMTRLENQHLDCDEKLFKKIVKQTFGQRRKMLRNTMKAFLKEEPILADSFFEQRPERLSVSDFVELTKLVEKAGSAEG